MLCMVIHGGARGLLVAVFSVTGPLEVRQRWRRKRGNFPTPKVCAGDRIFYVNSWRPARLLSIRRPV